MRLVFLGPINHSKKDVGGANTHILNLLDNLQNNKDLDIHVVSLSKATNTNAKNKQDGITYHTLKSPRLPKTVTGISVDHRALIKKVNEIKPDIIHAQILGAPYGLAAMKLCSRYPTVLTVHTLVEMDSKNQTGTVKEKIHDAIWKYLERREIKSIPNFISVSNSIAKEIKKRGAQNVQVIPNGISDEWFNIKNNEVEGRILFVGRVIPVKAIENLIRALKMVIASIPEAHLHIVGPTPDNAYKKKLDEIINNLELQDSIKFTGPKKGDLLVIEYSECAVFALPSKDESFGIVLLEAMAAGKPVIATNVGGIPEIITDKKMGMLIPFGDVNHLAETITKLLTEPEMRLNIGTSGKNKARKYSWAIIATQTSEYYKEVIDNFAKSNH